MGDTPIGWLSDLNAKYTPSSTQFDAARGHRASIEARLDSDLGVREMFEIGSLRHGTGVWIFSDADYLVSLKGIRPESVWTMLEKVKTSLEARFPSTTPRLLYLSGCLSWARSLTRAPFIARSIW